MSKLRHWLSELFARRYSMSERRMFAFLRQNVLFRQLSDHELMAFVPHLYERVYGKNEVIFFRNDPSQAFYLIKQGRVRLTLDTDTGFERLVVLSRYHYFGENAFLYRSNRLYNAVSISERTEVYAIPQVHLSEIFEDEPDIRSKILEALAGTYAQQLHRVFRAYSAAYGFFDLGRVCFAKPEDEAEDAEL
ncbi:MAG: cyclic nucleotide-binding domain-containing protein [Bernardetiaceae bacterium]